MGAISLLEKLGMDPGFKISDLTPSQRAELNELVETLGSEKNNPILSINEPTEPAKPDDEDEPSKEEQA